MKLFFSTTLLAAFASQAFAAPKRSNTIDLQNIASNSLAYAEGNNPLNAESMKKIQQKVNKLVNTIQGEAKNYGVDLNIQKVANQLKTEYEDDVKKGVKQAFQQGQKSVNEFQEKVENNPNFKKAAVEFAGYTSLWGFEGALNWVKKELKKQINEIDNQEIKENLNDLVDVGKTEAEEQMSEYQGEVKERIKQRVNQAGMDLNRAIKNF